MWTYFNLIKFFTQLALTCNVCCHLYPVVTSYAEMCEGFVVIRDLQKLGCFDVMMSLCFPWRQGVVSFVKPCDEIIVDHNWCWRATYVVMRAACVSQLYKCTKDIYVQVALGPQLNYSVRFLIINFGIKFLFVHY